MKFDVDFESSKGDHPAEIKLDEIKKMQETGELELTVPVGKNGKTKKITISGTDEEKKAMAEALLKSCKS